MGATWSGQQRIAAMPQALYSSSGGPVQRAAARVQPSSQYLQNDKLASSAVVSTRFALLEATCIQRPIL